MISPRVARGEALTALFDATAEEYEKPGPALKQALRDASPLHQVTAKSPPVFIVHNGPSDAAGPSDPRISGAIWAFTLAAFGLALAARLRQAGVNHGGDDRAGRESEISSAGGSVPEASPVTGKSQLYPGMRLRHCPKSLFISFICHLS